jgi:hypothetical protein
MEKNVERRKSFRMPFNTAVICHVNENEFQGTIGDLSVTGFFMETKNCPPTASKCIIEIIINGNHSNLRIEKLRGIVTRCDGNGAGIRFDDRLEWIALVPIYFHKIQEELTG